MQSKNKAQLLGQSKDNILYVVSFTPCLILETYMYTVLLTQTKAAQKVKEW
jgi:hypothetical protein